MRWTKGKPIAKAPVGVPILAAFDPGYWEGDRKPYYRVVVRRPGPFVGGKPTHYCLGWPGERCFTRNPTAIGSFRNECAHQPE